MPAADNIFLALGSLAIFLFLPLAPLCRPCRAFFPAAALPRDLRFKVRNGFFLASKTVRTGLFFLKLLSTSSSRLSFDTQPAGVFELAEDMCFHSAFGNGKWNTSVLSLFPHVAVFRRSNLHCNMGRR